MRRTILALLISCNIMTIYAQSEAHSIIRERMEAENIPGVAFLIAKDGIILDEGYLGKASLELDVQVTEKSVFAIASMTKTYTAAAILMMARQGLLDLDDSVKKYIPEAPETWEAITIRHLLTHTSGLIEDWELHDWNGSNAMFLSTQTNEGFLKIHFDMDLKFKPGTDSRYASGPFILGVVIERITGKDYETFLQENVFTPLSLQATWVDHPYKIIPNRVAGYFNYDPDIVASPVSGIGNGILIAPVAYGRGDAGIRTTTHDLLGFYNALFSDGLLDSLSRTIMFGPATLNDGNFVSTGAGWMNWPLGGMAISEHSGGFRTGFSSQALVIPEEKFVVIMLTNLRGGASFSTTQELASLYYPALTPLSKKSPVTDQRKEMTDKHLKCFQSISSSTGTDYFHSAFPFTYYSTRLKEVFSQTDSITFLGHKDVKNDDTNFFDVDIHTLRYYRLNGPETYYTTVYLDKNEQLVFIDFPETK